MNAVRKLSATPDLPELPGNDEEAEDMSHWSRTKRI
jgi:hypothetical protein